MALEETRYHTERILKAFKEAESTTTETKPHNDIREHTGSTGEK